MNDAPKLDQINLVVSDMAASVAFYRRLGVVIPDTAPEWDPHHRSADPDNGIDLDLDSDTFARVWDQGWSGARVVVGFKVNSRQRVDEIHDDLLSAGYRSQQQPYDAFWGARYAIIEDPDGNPVGIMSPVDPGQRSSQSPP
jgi:catechol 2,3-dioxygenase-like lactoylglutathione lyase family enzyme